MKIAILGMGNVGRVLGRRWVEAGHEVVFGVRKGEENLAGHAWLERDGRPFLEEREPDYVVTFRYPS